MPYVSQKQARKFHVLEREGKIAPATVREYDKATDFKHLPMRAPKKKRRFLRLRDYVE